MSIYFNRIHNNSSNIIYYQNLLNSLHYKYTDTQSRYHEAQSQLEIINKNLQSLQENKSAKERQYQNLSQQLSSAQQELNRFYLEYNSLVQKQVEAEAKEAQLRESCKGIKFWINYKLSELQSVNQKIEELKNSLSKPGPEPITKTRRYCFNNIENCKHHPNNIIKTICTNQSEVDAYKNKISQSPKELQELQAEKDQLRSAYSGLENRYSTVLNQYQNAQSINGELKAELQSVTQALEKQKVLVHNLQLDQSHINDEIRQLNNQIARAQSELFKYQQDVNFLKNELTNIQGQIDRANSSLVHSGGAPIDLSNDQLFEIARQEAAQEIANDKPAKNSFSVSQGSIASSSSSHQTSNDYSDDLLKKIAINELVQQGLIKAENVASQARNSFQEGINRTKEVIATALDLWPTGGIGTLTGVMMNRVDEFVGIKSSPTGNIIVDDDAASRNNNK